MSRPWKVALGRCTPRRASSPAPRRTISASGARLTTGASSPLSGGVTALGAGAAPVGIWHRGEPLRLDVLTAHRAGGIAPGGQAAQRRLDLLQLFLRGV